MYGRQELFNTEIHEYLTRRAQTAEHRLLQFRSDDSLNRFDVDEFIGGSLPSRVELVRSAAALRAEPTQDGTGTAVTLTIPFQGDEQLFTVWRSLRMSGPLVGEIRPDRGLSNQNQSVILSTMFNGTPSADQIRAWAKSTADQVESQLEDNLVAVEEFKQAWKPQVEQWLRERLAQRDKIQDLNDQLGTGI